MAITRSLEMDFVNELGRNVKIRIDDAREDIDGSEVSVAMDSILSKNIFSSSGGDLVSKQGAQVVHREVTELIIV